MKEASLASRRMMAHTHTSTVMMSLTAAIALIPVICLTFSSAIEENQIIGESTLNLFRLVDDNQDKTRRSGVVQVYLSGSWGNICADASFGITEADVICRQLGYSKASEFGSIATNSNYTEMFGIDDAPTAINDLSCESTQISISQCSFNTINISSDCMDNENDVVVMCNPQIFNSELQIAGNVRLIDGLYSNDGLLQVFCDDYWGTVCSERFSNQAALLACGQLGFNSFNEPFMVNSMNPVEDTVPIWFDISRPLTNCSFPPSMNEEHCLTSCRMCPNDVSDMSMNCTHSQDVRLICEHDPDRPPVRSTITTINSCLTHNPENEDDTTTMPAPSVTSSSTPADISTETIFTSAVIGSIVGGVAGLIIIVVLIISILVFLFVVMRHKNRRSESPRVIKSGGSSEDNLTTTRPNDYIRPPFMELKDVSTDKLSELLLPSLIQPDNLKLIEKIGQGEFGVVYRGLLTTHEKNEANVTSVAVKTLKGSYSKTQTDELIVEAEKMIQFQHLNVLSLTGVCVGLLESPCIVMPFMSNGSLLSYLRKEAADLTVSDSSNENVILDTTKHILSMCLQVAKGMTYLTEHKFVHRDLAARNCMISADGVIKVADFGLAEDVYTTEYFKQDRSSDESVKLPLKWMALESIHYGKFSEKSDVWSFGVLCWEVFSVGKSPYPGMGPLEVVEMLDAGNRLSKPSNAACCDKSYSFILTCWEQSPDKRPHFFELVESIEKLLGPLADYVDFTSNFARKFSS